MMKTLSIIIPVYNEERTIAKILEKVENVKLRLNKEIIIVDDGSTDNSKEIIENYLKKRKPNKKLSYKFKTKSNEGKGSAIKLGMKQATGDIIMIQDADLEYDPKDYPKLLKLILDGKAKVVYGSRFLKEHKAKYKIYYLGNIFLSHLTSFLYGQKITDMETCYKVFSGEALENMKLKSKKFDFEPEITSKILKRGYKIVEVPIKYECRDFSEGKKINWRDGVQAAWALVYWRFKN